MNAAQRRLLADQIRTAIERSGKTQAEIAAATGIHKSALSRFVREERGVSFDAAEKIAAFLNLHIVEAKKK
jgi:transcriptional regulator with XRE-family HTH domain